MDTFSNEVEAAAFIARTCFRPGPARRIGVELEWLVHPGGDEWITDGLPYGGAVSREPGGQVELSSLPADDLAACVTAVEADQAALEAALADRGQTVRGGGYDPSRPPQRVLDLPRYRAMEAFFDREGPWGRMMMCSTASIQVNLDAGDDGDGPTGLRRRWDLVHRLGPVLVAAFANSPLLDGGPSGWKSTRQAVWSRLDAGRIRPLPDTDDPPRDFAQYALDARVICHRCDPPAPWTVPPDLTLRTWIRDGLDGRGPTEDDIRYHLTTLFPPVRPRGWLELRMIDQQDGDGWIVPVTVAATLLDDPTAAEAAYEATAALCGGGAQPPWAWWIDSARFGPADPLLRAVAQQCFTVAAEALRRNDAPPRLRDALAAFRERHLDRGRCPADDRLDRALSDQGPSGHAGPDRPLPLAVEAPS